MWFSNALTILFYGSLLGSVLLGLAAMRSASAKLMLGAALCATPFLLYTTGYQGTRLLSPAILAVTFAAALAFARSRAALGRALALPLLLFAAMFVVLVLAQDWISEVETTTRSSGEVLIDERSTPMEPSVRERGAAREHEEARVDTSVGPRRIPTEEPTLTDDQHGTAVFAVFETVEAMPTREPLDADELVAAAEAAYARAESRDQAFYAALEIVTWSKDPAVRQEYERYIASLAETAVASNLPWPFPVVAPTAEPGATLTSSEISQLVFTEAFRRACSEPENLGLSDVECMEEATRSLPSFVRALSRVDRTRAVPIARTGLAHANLLTALASIEVLCAHKDVVSYDAIASAAAALKIEGSPGSNIPVASALLSCEDPELDALGLALLDGDKELFDGLR